MTKRPRPEECEVVWPVNLTQPDIEIDPGKRPEGIKEGEGWSVAPSDHSGCGGKAADFHQSVCIDVACAEVAVANVASVDVSLTGEYDTEVAPNEVLGDGPFWALLSRAGYSSW